MDWKDPSRFVVMRIPKEQKGDRQLKLPESEKYVYRIFVTNETMRPYNVVAGYDPRADAENLIGEAQREGVLAIPSKKFQAHHAFLQIAILAYNLWRWMKLLAGHKREKKSRNASRPRCRSYDTHRSAQNALRGSQDPIPRKPR